MPQPVRLGGWALGWGLREGGWGAWEGGWLLWVRLGGLRQGLGVDWLQGLGVGWQKESVVGWRGGWGAGWRLESEVGSLPQELGGC